MLTFVRRYMDNIRMERGLRIMNNLNNIPFQDLLKNCSKSEFITLSAMASYMDSNNTDRINVNKIAELTCVSVPAISRLIKNLELRKFVKRDVDIFNRRNTHVSFTKKGREMLAEDWKVVKIISEKTFSTMTDTEKDKMIESFEKLYMNLSSTVEAMLKEKKKC